MYDYSMLSTGLVFVSLLQSVPFLERDVLAVPCSYLRNVNPLQSCQNLEYKRKLFLVNTFKFQIQILCIVGTGSLRVSKVLWVE